jgi:predicted nucleic acid-binding protein
MAHFVIDPQTLLALAQGQRLLHPSHQLVAPNCLRSEALQLLLGAVHRNELTERKALELHELMTGVKIRLLGDRSSRQTAWRIARQNGWETIRDAEYVAVTMLQADALVTIDSQLAANADGLVSVVEFEMLFVGAVEVEHDG